MPDVKTILEQWFREFNESLFDYTARLAKDPSLAEEVVCDVWAYAAAANAEVIQSVQAPEAWLKTTARSRLIDRQRERKRRKRLAAKAAALRPRQADQANDAPPPPTVEESWQYHRELVAEYPRHVAAALDALVRCKLVRQEAALFLRCRPGDVGKKRQQIRNWLRRQNVDPAMYLRVLECMHDFGWCSTPEEQRKMAAGLGEVLASQVGFALKKGGAYQQAWRIVTGNDISREEIAAYVRSSLCGTEYELRNLALLFCFAPDVAGRLLAKIHRSATEYPLPEVVLLIERLRNWFKAIQSWESSGRDKSAPPARDCDGEAQIISQEEDDKSARKYRKVLAWLARLLKQPNC